MVQKTGNIYYTVGEVCRAYECLLDPMHRFNNDDKLEGYDKPMLPEEIPASFIVIPGKDTGNETPTKPMVKFKPKTYDTSGFVSLLGGADLYNMFNNQHFPVTDQVSSFSSMEHKVHRMLQQMRVSGYYPHFIKFESDQDMNIIASYVKEEKQFKTSAGKLLRQLPWFFKRSDADIEKLCNVLKSILFQDIEFNIVEGEDIRKWYHESRYYYKAGSLSNSCMRYSSCQDYLDMYCKTDVKMLIATNPDGKLCGRALLWPRSMWNKNYFEHSDYIMDRIYGVESTIIQFKKYAEHYKFTYKQYQNFSDNQSFMTPSDGTKNAKYIAENKRMQMNWDQCGFDYWPYADTFNILKDDQDGVKNHGSGETLTETDGHASDSERRTECYDCGCSVDREDVNYVNDNPMCNECSTYSEYSDDYYRVDDTVYSDYLNSYLWYEDASEISHGQHRGDWIHHDECTEVYCNDESVIPADECHNKMEYMIPFLREDTELRFQIYLSDATALIGDNRVYLANNRVDYMRISESNSSLPPWCSERELDHWYRDYLFKLRSTEDGKVYVDLRASTSESFDKNCWDVIIRAIKAIEYTFGIQRIENILVENNDVSAVSELNFNSGLTTTLEHCDTKFEPFIETLHALVEHFNITTDATESNT